MHKLYGTFIKGFYVRQKLSFFYYSGRFESYVRVV